MRKLSRDEIVASGARKVRDPATKPESKAPEPPSFEPLAEAISASNAALIGQLQQMLKQQTKPSSFRFIIKRDSRGLLESVDGHLIP